MQFNLSKPFKTTVNTLRKKITFYIHFTFHFNINTVRKLLVFDTI